MVIYRKVSPILCYDLLISLRPEEEKKTSTSLFISKRKAEITQYQKKYKVSVQTENTMAPCLVGLAWLCWWPLSQGVATQPKQYHPLSNSGVDFWPLDISLFFLIASFQFYCGSLQFLILLLMPSWQPLSVQPRTVKCRCYFLNGGMFKLGFSKGSKKLRRAWIHHVTGPTTCRNWTAGSANQRNPTVQWITLHCGVFWFVI